MKNKLFNFILLSFCLCFVVIGISGCAHTHNFGNWQTLSPATCTDAEVLFRTCSDCQHQETKYGKSALQHSIVSSTTPPTSTTKGYTLFWCERAGCNYQYTSNYTYLISFESITENSNIQASGLPVYDDKIYAEDEIFEGVNNTNEYKVVEYRIYETNDVYEVFEKQSTFTNSLTLTIVWDFVKTQEQVQREQTLNDVISKIEMLEQISNQYNIDKSSTNNAQTRVMQFIRLERYGTNIYNMVGGTIENDFESYIQTYLTVNNSSYTLQDLKGLQSILNIQAPITGENIDFVHMDFILNVVARGSTTSHAANDLSGWGGDICQLVVDLKNLNLSQDQIQSKANELFKNANSGFSEPDLYANLDALNIMKIYEEQTTKSISSAIQTYYQTDVYSTRITQFKSIVGFEDYTSIDQLDELSTYMFENRLKNNMAITIWCNQNGINFTEDEALFKASTNAFARYLLS